MYWSWIMLLTVPRFMTRSTTSRLFSTLDDKIQDFVQKNQDHTCQLVVSVAGGGGSFLSSLASTPGASKILLEGTITYDRESYRQYVKPVKIGRGFKYCSEDSVHLAADAARRKAIRLAACAETRHGENPIHRMTKAVGLACSSTLKSSAQDKSSKAFVAVQRAIQEGSYRLTAELKGDRIRKEEDAFVAECMLTCLEHALIETKDDLSYTTDEGDEITLYVPKSVDPPQSILNRAAQRILRNEDKTVMLLFNENKFEMLSDTVLPPNSIVFPGSFNPPHEGHVGLVEAALEASGRKIAWFEMSLTNPDKPSMEEAEVVRRLERFSGLSVGAPWGVILTQAPLFFQKLEYLRPCMTDPETALSFVIGTDTLERILDPKYYNNDRESMLAQLRFHQPSEFVVGGRLQQKSDNPEFVQGHEIIANLPEDLRSNFLVLDEFRMDVSSTEIRERERENQNS